MGIESLKQKTQQEVKIIYIYNYMHMGLWWPPAATEMRPGASPQSRGYVFTGPVQASSMVTDHPGTPVTPGYLKKEIIAEVLHLFRCYTHTHAHTIFHIQLCHTHTTLFYFSVLHHLLCLSFLVPATTFGDHYWKKLPCGVIRSFNLTKIKKQKLISFLFLL